MNPPSGPPPPLPPPPKDLSELPLNVLVEDTPIDRITAQRSHTPESFVLHAEQELHPSLLHLQPVRSAQSSLVVPGANSGGIASSIYRQHSEVDPASELRQWVGQHRLSPNGQGPHDGRSPQCSKGNEALDPQGLLTAQSLEQLARTTTGCSPSPVLHPPTGFSTTAADVDEEEGQHSSNRTIPSIHVQNPSPANAVDATFAAAHGARAGEHDHGLFSANRPSAAFVESLPYTSLLDLSLKPGESKDDVLKGSPWSVNDSMGDDEEDSPGPSAKQRFLYYAPAIGHVLGDDLYTLADASTLQKKYSLESLLSLPGFWLDVTAPTAGEMKLLASIFRIHPLTSEDIQTEKTREKFEVYRSYYFICYSALDLSSATDHYLEPFNIYVLVYSKFVISFHAYPLPSARNVVKRLYQLKSYVEITSHWINYALLDDITDAFAPIIDSIQNEVDTIDDLVLILSQSEQGDMLRRIAYARKKVMTLQRAMSAKAEVLRVLLKRLESLASATALSGAAAATSFKDTVLYLGDVQDHVLTMSQLLVETATTLSRAHSNYLASISIEITQSSNRTNDTMTKLTALASVLLPLNVITGLWGMNVRVPGMADEASSYGWFIGILCAMSVVVIGGFLWVRYVGLFTRKS